MTEQREGERDSATSGDVFERSETSAAIERLREWNSERYGGRMLTAVALDVSTLLAEVERLRAVIEDQHSDETYKRIGVTLYGDDWHNPHIGAHDIRDQTVRRVLSVLTADPVRAAQEEADQ